MSRTARYTSFESSANGAACRTVSRSSSTPRSSTAHIATSCCASTSSGLRRYRVCSISPASIRSATTAASSRSPRNFGKIRPRDGSPTWWPARPIRWSPLATDPGDSTWITRSTAPMSMPSSREDVATIPRSRPSFSASSTSRRCSRASEPWCARTRSSSASSLRLAASRSARRRAFVKTIVDRCARISSSSAGWIDGQIERVGCGVLGTSSSTGARASRAMPPPMSSTGTTTCSSIGLRWPASTIVTGRSTPSSEPPRNRAISSRGRWVADRPIRCGGSSQSSSSRSSDRARCEPRLDAAIAWISSTITVRTLRSVSRADDVSIR